MLQIIHKPGSGKWVDCAAMRYTAALFFIFGLATVGCANVEPADSRVGRFGDFGPTVIGDSAITRDLGAATYDGAVAVVSATDLKSVAGPVDFAAVDLAQPTVDDLAMRVVDLAHVATPPDLASPPPTCTPRINEVQTSSSTSAYYEFVELYNPCHAPLAKYTIVYRASTNTSSVAAGNDTATLYTFASSPPASAGDYLVYGGRDLPEANERAALDHDGMADDGAVGLRDASGTLVDSVGFGSVSASSAFLRGKAATGASRTAAPGQSVSRVYNGVDSGNNGKDFHAVTATPGASND